MQLPYSNTKITHWNPGASMPLVMPVHLICNTSDEQIYSNIRENSKRPGKWIKSEAAHDGVAVLCGSGPSLADTLPQIKELAAAGAKVFAMNGAAKFLYDNGIFPDYQVMIDARPQTAELIGPAREHLFASQCDPECFRRAPDARLWHLQVGNIENEFPEDADAYCLIGGAASVGNTATCLAYAMGYRRLEIFGYDSSHKDNAGHAFRQPMNDGDPICSVTFNGREYIASLTMKLQAEKFIETSRALKGAGCTLNVHGSGLLPDMYNAPELSEKEKYTLMWAQPEYRICAPGESLAKTFVQIAKPEGTVIDFGCGTGRGALEIERLTECKIVTVDFATNCRDPQAERLEFVQCDLSDSIPIRGNFGYCTDVLEHIPPDKLDRTITNITGAAASVFFQISLVPDSCGGLIGHPLHLSVHPFTWWADLFARLGLRVLWSRDDGDSALFYVATKHLEK